MEEKEAIKNAFENVKKDVFQLSSNLFDMNQKIETLSKMIKGIEENIFNLNLKVNQSTLNSSIPTDKDSPTDKAGFEGLKDCFLDTSTRNEGVPTDRQANQQTDRQMDFSVDSVEETISKASVILNSLDVLKKQLRLKFKAITPQEMLVFSVIYQLEEQGDEEIDYLKIAKKIKLSQSSIRDYVHKLIQKGISIHKKKYNNKRVFLSISPEIKRIASLEMILKLREI